jgi:membrane glycosyltransferase
MISILPGERIIVGIRKHWFVFALEISGMIIAAVVPFVLASFAERIMPDIVAVVGVAQFENGMLFLLACWLVLLAMIFFISFTSYYLDMLVVTSQRLIDIDQKSLFSRDVATAPIHNVEDVKIESIGIFATLFGFGNLHIQTAAETKEIVIRGIRRPERAKDIIMQAYQENIASTGRQN